MKKLVKKNENRLMNINIQAFGACRSGACSCACYGPKHPEFDDNTDRDLLPTLHK